MTWGRRSRVVWRPAALTHRDSTVLITVTVIFAVIRGIDYFTGDDPTSRASIMAEQLMPLTWWAVVLWVGAALLLVGRALTEHVVVFLGHLVLAVTYSSLALGLAGSYVADILLHGWHPWALDGVRGVGPLATTALIHVIFAARTGPRPIPADAAVTQESVSREVL